METLEVAIPFLNAAQRALSELERRPIQYIGDNGKSVCPELLVTTASHNLTVLQEMLGKISDII